MSRLIEASEDGSWCLCSQLTDVVVPEGWGICLVFLIAIEQVFVEIQTLVCLRSYCLPTKIFLSELGPTSHLKRYTTVECFAKALPTKPTISSSCRTYTSANAY
jgi:hypothetical protein